MGPSVYVSEEPVGRQPPPVESAEPDARIRPTVGSMLISGRDVAAYLGDTSGVHRKQVRALLAAGVAGEPVKVGRAHLYEKAVVAELARRRPMTDPEIEELCPRGPFIARVGAARAFHTQEPWEQQAEVLAEWYTSILARVWMAIERPIRFPFVATVADFVVWGADIVGWTGGALIPDERDPRRQMTRLEFSPPGDWFAGFANRRIWLGPGYPYFIIGAPVAGPAWAPGSQA